MTKFIASTSPDHFGSEVFDSPDEAIKNLIKKERMHPGEIVYVGTASKPQFPTRLIDPNAIVTDLIDALTEQIPIEVFGEWPNITISQIEEIGKSIDITVEVMLRRMGIWPPKFHAVTEIEEVDVLGEDEESEED